MQFCVETKSGEYPIDINPSRVFVIGYSGSNMEKNNGTYKRIGRKNWVLSHRQKFQQFLRYQKKL